MDKKISRNKYSLFGVMMVVCATFAYSSITGTAFRDYNGDGLKQSGEPAVAGVIVKAYKNDSANKDLLVTTATTNQSGAYTLNVAGSVPVRLEFEVPSANCNLKSSQDFSSAGGANYGTSVQFANSNSEIHNFAISHPSDYSIDENPKTFTSIMNVGDPLAGGNAGEASAIIKFDFNASGQAHNSGGGANNGPAWVELTKAKYVGTIRGLAYSKQARRIFAGAYVKRHAGLGPLGSGGIYIINPDINNTGTSTQFLNLDSLGIATHGSGAYTNAMTASGSNEVYFSAVVGSNSDRNLSANSETPSRDSAAYGQVGRLGLGDIDISEDGKYLFVVNLYDRKLYKIDLTDPKNPTPPNNSNKNTKITSYQIPDSCSYSQEAGEYRPFGLKITRNQAYVGIVCSGQDGNGTTVATSNTDMKGSVYRLDLSTGVWANTPEVEWTFDYRDSETDTDGGHYSQWHPWTDKFIANSGYAIPMIGDIDFDIHGNMVVGIIDIHADQTGHHNLDLNGNNNGGSGYITASKGDLLKFDLKNSPNVCEYNVSLTPEFYDDQLKHNESTGGMITEHHTSTFESIMSTAMDPLHAWSSGTVTYRESNGSIKRVYEVLVSNYNQTGIGKTNGLGDLETMEAIPPIEIGNLVWLDSDGDGVQDGGEQGIAGVKVKLLDSNNNIVGITTSDSHGNYMFNQTNVNVNSTEAGLKPNANYSIMIDSTQFNNGVGVNATPLANMQLTHRDAQGTSSNPDESDSDAKVEAGKAVIHITTQGAGHNNHSFDFGFTTPKACLGDRVWYDDNYNGIQDSGEIGVGNVVVTLYKDGNPTGDSNTTDSNGNYQFCNLDDGNYSVQFDKTTLPAGAVITKQNIGTDDTIDSDANPSDGKTNNVTLHAGDNNTSLDMGIFVPACIGNLVWLDSNKDGIQNSNEGGINGVGVKLYDSNNNQITQDAYGNSLMTETNSTGNYEFCNLKPGSYYVKVDTTNYQISPKDSGSDDTLDSDIDSSGKMPTENLQRGENNTSYDAGLYMVPIIGAGNKICLGDIVWYDSNVNGIQDNGELGVRNIVVDLFDENGTKIRTSKTDDNGKYKFCNLEPNKNYKIKIHLPSTYHITLKNKGANDSKDSDSDSSGVILVNKPATSNMSFDAGIYCDCEDYKTSSKKSSGSALNIFGLMLMMLVTIGLVAKVEEK